MANNNVIAQSIGFDSGYDFTTVAAWEACIPAGSKSLYRATISDENEHGRRELVQFLYFAISGAGIVSGTKWELISKSLGEVASWSGRELQIKNPIFSVLADKDKESRLLLEAYGLSYLVPLQVEVDPPEDVELCVMEFDAKLVEKLSCHPEIMRDIDPRKFEELIAELLCSFGWDVELTKRTNDGGYDIFGISTGVEGVRNAWLIECKRYAEDYPVGVAIVRAAYGAADFQGGGASTMIVTTSRFTRGAKKLSEQKLDLDLRDFQDVKHWLEKYEVKKDGKLYLPPSIQCETR